MKSLRVHYLQHVAHEGLASIEEWVTMSGHSLTKTLLSENSVLPGISEIDFLIIMGGPMSVNDEAHYSWLSTEKLFIREAIDAGKTVLGICLGSQLIASSLGAGVYKNNQKEIGWFDIELIRSANTGFLFSDLGEKLRVFHWHGDTYDLPRHAKHLALSEGCLNQAFIYKDKVLALQFHLEVTQVSLQKMIDNGREELKPGRYIQTEKEILANDHFIELNRKVLFKLLDRLAGSEYK